jgi:hypothetical protein
MARGAERVLKVLVIKADELDSELKKPEVQNQLFMTQVRPAGAGTDPENVP